MSQYFLSVHYSRLLDELEAALQTDRSQDGITPASAQACLDNLESFFEKLVPADRSRLSPAGWPSQRIEDLLLQCRTRGLTFKGATAESFRSKEGEEAMPEKDSEEEKLDQGKPNKSPALDQAQHRNQEKPDSGQLDKRAAAGRPQQQLKNKLDQGEPKKLVAPDRAQQPKKRLDHSGANKSLAPDRAHRSGVSAPMQALERQLRKNDGSATGSHTGQVFGLHEDPGCHAHKARRERNEGCQHHSHTNRQGWLFVGACMEMGLQSVKARVTDDLAQKCCCQDLCDSGEEFVRQPRHRDGEVFATDSRWQDVIIRDAPFTERTVL